MSNVSTKEIYRKLILLMLHSKRHLVMIMEDMNMTPVQGMLLMAFEGSEGKSMNQLSYMMGCDASNITGLVDRLDVQNLIERTIDPADRRVKLIRLSDKGRHCRNKILSGLADIEAVDLAVLSPEERNTLADITNKLFSREDK